MIGLGLLLTQVTPNMIVVRTPFGCRLCRSIFHQSIKRHHSTKNVKNIKKILIANRGEIACRIIRTARSMGIQSVCVFSDPDRHSLPVSMADEAYYIGSATASESYLRKDKILNAAKESGANAVHPGYGFLSESTEFADACEEENIIFIGPPASAIRDMGIKSTSKHIMSSAGVPIVEGYHGEDQSIEKLYEEARRIGFPVMIKAVRGGGGKGMRIAMTESEFMEQLNSAKTEAIKSFGDEVMLIEKFVQRPRHVEVQVFGDKHDNYVYLFERDCSVQRRHQKIIEEAPAPGVNSEIRKSLGDAAVRAARAVRYEGAGTVEFILDKDFNFYFMEMNTRLQVEHPVSEMITGTDLVEWQIRVAAGEPLPLKQEDLFVNGHSFEGRIYAENPANNFMPGAGTLHRMATPAPQKHIRIETGVRQGDEVSVHYDPMIAKLIVWGKNRETALTRLNAALLEFNIVGLNTNIEFLMSLANHPKFIEGDVHTDFIPEHKKKLFPEIKMSSETICKAALSIVLREQIERLRSLVSTSDPTSPFRPSVTRRFNNMLLRTISIKYGEEEKQVRVISLEEDQFKVCFDDVEHIVSGTLKSSENVDILVSTIDGNLCTDRVMEDGDKVHIFSKSGTFEFCQPAPKFMSSLRKGVDLTGGGIAPMPGVVEKVCVEEGQHVSPGDPLVVMIAMKMEYVIKAPQSGVVEKVLHQAGESVPKDATLVRVKPDEE